MNNLFECAAMTILRTLTSDGESPISGSVRSGNRYKPTDEINKELLAAGLPRGLVSVIVGKVNEANHDTLMREIRMLKKLSERNMCSHEICPSHCNYFRRRLVFVSSSLGIPVWEVIHESKVSAFGRGLFDGPMFQMVRRTNTVDFRGRLYFVKFNGHVLTPILKQHAISIQEKLRALATIQALFGLDPEEGTACIKPSSVKFLDLLLLFYLEAIRGRRIDWRNNFKYSLHLCIPLAEMLSRQVSLKSIKRSLIPLMYLPTP